ncbi:MAG: hypothetical protein K2Z81_05840, partial [Cyanobacteria bacterium]|nr:hypothetical protein [Cyanobacteriota bacterium]
TDQDIRQAGTSITALNSQRASEIEAALTRNNMATLVGSYTTRPGGMSFAQRDQTILGLVNASTNTEISPEARRLAMQTLSAAVSNDSQINTTLPQALPLITRLATEGNRNAQQVLLNFANSGDASATVAQEASGVLLEQGRQNPAFRDSILQTPITPANMPLMAALMSGASTVGTPAQARQQIIDLARNGNERAVSILLSVSTSSESGVAGNHRAAPTRESTWNAISEMYRWAQVPIRDGARESQDMGMGNLLQQLDQRLSQNSPSSWIAPTQEAYFHAARALLHISESSDIPTGFRQQALSMLSRSVSANYEAVMNNQRNGSEFRTSTALLSSLSSNPDAMRRLAEQFNVPGPNSLRNTVEHLQQTATRGFWNADNERAVTALLTIANNQLAPASVRTQARDGLRAAAEGTNADRVLPRLRDAAGYDNNAAATVLS